MRPARVGVDPEAPAPRREDARSPPLFALPRFPVVVGAFCAARLVRPILLAACFPDGPHVEDVGTEFALALGWMAAALGWIGAMLLLAPLKGLIEEAGGAAAEELRWQTQLLALCLLSFAVVLDGLHQVMALTRADFFWSAGFLGDAEGQDGAGWELPVAGMLAVLHALGLLGTLLLVCKYWRHYRAAWRQLLQDDPGRPRPIFEDHGDFEDELAEGKALWRCPACDEPNRADRTFCNNCSGLRPHVARADAVGKSGAWTTSAPARGGGQGAAGSGSGGGAAAAEAAGAPAQAGGPRGAAVGSGGSGAPAPGQPGPKAKAAQGRPLRPFATAGVDFAEGGAPAGRAPPDVEAPRRRSATPPGRPRSTTPPAGARGPAGAPRGREPGDFVGPLGSPPLAWLWAGGEWLRVRVLRTEGGGATVRLPGGAVVSTSQKLLRPRDSDEEEAPPPPPQQQAGGTGGSQAAAQGPRPARAASAPASGAPAQPSGPEEQWASERMARLRTELCELDALDPGERKARLRTLQRELHPDKQPPELRKHAEPLFHLVQRQWEVEESLQKVAAQSGG